MKIYNQPLFKIRTEAKQGDNYSEYSVKVGTVRMKEHPNFAKLKDDINNRGFKIIEHDPSSSLSIEDFVTRIEHIKLINCNKQNLGSDKILYAKPNMRYLDLEHEAGHIEQLYNLKWNLFTDIIEIDENSKQKKWSQNKSNRESDVMKDWHNTVLEYENRLQEFVRLESRNASKKLLEEHSAEEFCGVDYWRQAHEKALKKSRRRRDWSYDNFPETRHGSNLRKEYEKIKLSLFSS